MKEIYSLSINKKIRINFLIIHFLIIHFLLLQYIMKTRKQHRNKRRNKSTNNRLEKEFRLDSLKNTSREREERQIKKDFIKLDADRSGYIDLKELRQGLKRYGIKLSLNRTRQLMRRYDNDPDNQLEIREFIQLKRDIDAKSFRRNKKRPSKKSSHRKKY